MDALDGRDGLAAQQATGQADRRAGRIAVVGAGGPLSAAVVRALADEHDDLLVIDPSSSALPLPGVEVRAMDVRDRLLPLALDGVDTIVHCAFTDDLVERPDAAFGHNVGGTRNLLAAADKVGVRRVVMLSRTWVYGAHADNPVPLHESDPARANPGIPAAFQHQLVEDLLHEWAATHPSATTCVLRRASVLDAEVDPWVARWLLGPRLLAPVGSAGPWQFVAVQDVASAVALTVRTGASGIYNVASDGWLSAADLASLLGRSVQRTGVTTMAEGLRRLGRLGLAVPAPDAVALLTHPVVVESRSLQALGWRATVPQRELVIDFARRTDGLVAVGSSLVPKVLVRRVALGLAAGTAMIGMAVARWLRRSGA